MLNNTVRTIPRDLGVAAIGDKVFLLTNLLHQTADPLCIGVSTDGLRFKQHKGSASITDQNGKKETINLCSDFHISQVGGQYVLTYKLATDEGLVSCIAFSKDGMTWKKEGTLLDGTDIGIVVPNFTYRDQYVMYLGERDLKVAFSSDLKTWEVDHEPVLKPDHGRFDKFPLEVGSIIPTQAGILVIYYVNEKRRDGTHTAVGAALFDSRNPKKLLWRKMTPIWEPAEDLQSEVVYPLGALRFKDQFILYVGIEGRSVFAVCYPSFDELFDFSVVTPKPLLKKHEANPLITPVLKHAWEASAVFNPAALHEGGKVHLVYRAMGPNNTSVLGYAASEDGYTFDTRHKEPIYVPTEPFETPNGLPFNPKFDFMSGGGYGGVEDPRLTKIDDKIYLTYVAFNGVDHPRVAMSSIPTESFMNHEWSQWSKPKLISRPGVVNKNAVLFPEKIGGKFVMMHRVFPNILIDFLDDLEFSNPRYLQGHHIIKPRDNAWDSRKAGAGAPPIKTKDGWLLIYHAVDDRDASQYKIGAMLLDLNNPVKVLYRSNHPIITPTEWYENEGYKSGVAYPCGAVVKDDDLIVYYGGADTVICAASKNLDEFLDELKETSPVKPDPIPARYPVMQHLYA